MPEVKMNKEQHRVDLVEYDRFMGSKIDDKKYFDSEADAIKFCKEFNSVNCSPTVPDWYMIAEYRGIV